MQLNPARGRKLYNKDSPIVSLAIPVYAAQPREGTETGSSMDSLNTSWVMGLCSSTPRGDGNLAVKR